MTGRSRGTAGLRLLLGAAAVCLAAAAFTPVTARADDDQDWWRHHGRRHHEDDRDRRDRRDRPDNSPGGWSDAVEGSWGGKRFIARDQDHGHDWDRWFWNHDHR